MKTFARLMHLATACAATSYCAGVVTLLALWQVAPNRWWSALSNTIAIVWFVPLLLFIPVALASRSWWVRAMIAAPCAIFLALFGERFVPAQRSAPAGAILRVATLNQNYVNQHPDAVAAAIQAQQADVVALQELSPRTSKVLAQLSTVFPYQLLEPRNNQGGIGLISRYPFSVETPISGVLSQRLTVHTTDGDVVMVNTHIHHDHLIKGPAPIFRGITIIRGYDTDSQMTQVQALRAQLRDVREPLVVLGDFNTGDREPAYAVMAEQFQDTYQQAGWGFGFTFPNNAQIKGVPIPFPLVRIDYVWINNALQTAAARTVCAGGSDHCMVVADVYRRAAKGA